MSIVFLNPTGQLGGTERSLRDLGETPCGGAWMGAPPYRG